MQTLQQLGHQAPLSLSVLRLRKTRRGGRLRTNFKGKARCAGSKMPGSPPRAAEGLRGRRAAPALGPCHRARAPAATSGSRSPAWAPRREWCLRGQSRRARAGQQGAGVRVHGPRSAVASSPPGERRGRRGSRGDWAIVSCGHARPAARATARGRGAAGVAPPGGARQGAPAGGPALPTPRAGRLPSPLLLGPPVRSLFSHPLPSF